MKRQLLLGALAGTLALAGCATYEENQGGTSAETGAIHGQDQSTSDFGRGEVWRNTPAAQRERGQMEGPIGPPLPDDRAAGDYHP